MDRMLHRGKYAVEGETSLAAEDKQTLLEKLGWTKEFTRSDKVVAGVTLGWPLVWFVVFIVGNCWHLLRKGGDPQGILAGFLALLDMVHLCQFYRGDPVVYHWWPLRHYVYVSTAAHRAGR
jgi:hypothetical protein